MINHIHYVDCIGMLWNNPNKGNTCLSLKRLNLLQQGDDNPKTNNSRFSYFAQPNNGDLVKDATILCLL